MSHAITYVAHPDDDLIFFNPDILSDIRAGHRAWIVYLTAGNLEPGQAGMAYADQRIQGVRAAWAVAAEKPNAWSYQALTVGGRTVATNYLTSNPNVRLVFPFMNAAAGSDNGDLHRMWADPTFVAQPIDGKPGYTRSQFVAMLRALADHMGPDFVRCHDPGGQKLGDNIDHDRAGKLVVQSNLDGNHMARRLDAYFGYCAQPWSINVGEPWSSYKYAAWQAYKPHDPAFPAGSTAWDNMATRQYMRHLWQPGDTYTPML